MIIVEDRGEELPLVQRAHRDLGRLGVYWHTQGSGKSYSIVMFTEKVRRDVPGNFTFVIVTDREDLDDQIWRTFVGCGVVDPKTTTRASSGVELKELLQKNHSFVFALIHKFNQPVDPKQPYSERDDIIVISDEAHRTQSGKFARNVRLALPNAAFIGFTGTPLFNKTWTRWQSASTALSGNAATLARCSPRQPDQPRSCVGRPVGDAFEIHLREARRLSHPAVRTARIRSLSAIQVFAVIRSRISLARSSADLLSPVPSIFGIALTNTCRKSSRPGRR